MMKSVLIKLIKAYQYIISPWLGNNCRFYPCCSNYFIQSVEQYGLFVGVKLGIKRILKCHPFSEGGIDHVPPVS